MKVNLQIKFTLSEDDTLNVKKEWNLDSVMKLAGAVKDKSIQDVSFNIWVTSLINWCKLNTALIDSILDPSHIVLPWLYQVYIWVLKSPWTTTRNKLLATTESRFS